MSRWPVGKKAFQMTGLALLLIVIGLILTRSLSKQGLNFQIRERSLKILQDTLQEQDPFSRGAAAKAMGDSRDPAVLSWLATASKDTDSTVRLFTVEAAARFGAQTAIRFIDPALADPDPSVRLTAVRVLSGLKSAAPPSLLKKALTDEDPAVQLLGLGTAVGALGMDSYPGALKIFEKALKNENPEARLIAATGLGKTGDVRALPLLAHTLRDPDATVRSYAAQALTDLGTVHAVPVLSNALSDPDAGVRSQVALALGAYRTSDVSILLQQAAQDSDPFVRLSAAVALSKQNDPQTLDLLKRALADSDYGIRSAAARSFGEIVPSEDPDFGRKAAALLVPLLKDPSSRVRSAATRALGMIGKPEVLPDLTERLNDAEGSVRCYAAGAILRILHEAPQTPATRRDASLQNPMVFRTHPS